MGFYVYITQECKKDAKRYGLTGNIEKLKKRLIREQRTGSLFDNFPPPYLKKRFERQQRLLAAERFLSVNQEKHLIVCFYRILIRGSDEYEKGFLGNPREWGDKHLYSLASDEVLENWLRENQPPPAPEKQTPDVFEQSFLWDIMSSSRSSKPKAEIIYESSAWIDVIKEERLKRRLINFPDAILNLCTSADHQKVFWPVDSDVQIMARIFPDTGRIFLISPVWKSDAQYIENLQNQYATLLAPDACIDNEQLARESGRAYPYELLLNKDLWISAEEDEVANLALSAEEATLLEDVHRYDATSDSNTGLPLFINGRAGSGKSTVLQYLYADYLRHYLLNEERGSRKGTLYLTCSQELLERSRKAIHSLVMLNPDNTERESLLSEQEISDAVTTSSLEFHSFLYSFLSKEEQEKIFPLNSSGSEPQGKGTRVNYAFFARMWEKSFAHNPEFKQFTPELAWHVIRTYIKGMGTDEFLTPEDYCELDNKEKSVSQNTFEGIYDTVWKRYKEECKEKQLWDDQDLARYLLAEGKIPSEFVAVFCDEAQDFTRIELEIILRLSVFSERKLAPEEIGRVPFVFAGDPFQTLNPTGFRWEAVKATFFQKFIASLDPVRNTGRTDINYRELHFNYRSTPSIVKFTNNIQALRSALFQQAGILPQIPWQHGDGGDPPCWFNWDDEEQNLSDKIDQNQDVIIIIPCRDGEETAFVKDDPRLSEWIPMDESGVPRNVLSAIRAKGLEFSRVALYGFGAHAPEELLSSLQNQNTKNCTPEWILPKEYFINRLYVAASRGKNQMFVIDSRDGYRRLWEVFEEKSFNIVIDSFSPEDRQTWEENLGGMLLPGTVDSWQQGRGDLNEIAKNYELEGKARKDPYLLRAAAINYESLGNNKQATLCRAIAYQYEENFTKAGDLYVEINDVSSALEMFWTGELYEKISALGRQYSQVQSSLEYRFVDVYNKRNTSGLLQVLSDFNELLDDRTFRGKTTATQFSWKKIISNLLALTFSSSQQIDTDWDRLCTVCESLFNRAYVNASQMAHIYYRVGEYDKTLEVLERVDRPDHGLLQETKTQILLRKIEKSRDVLLSGDELRLLAHHYRKTGEYIEAVNYASQYHGISDIENILQDVEQSHPELVTDILSPLLREYACEAHWAKLINFLQTEKLSIGQKKISWNPSPDEIWRIRLEIIETLASSKELNNAGLENIQAISKVVLEWSQRSDCWEHIHPLVAGAVLERVARDIDCLQFYENLFSEQSQYNQNISFEAKKRWLVCKQRQIDREVEQAKTRKRAQEHKEEYIKCKVKWGIDHPENEPDYPDISRVDRSEEIFKTTKSQKDNKVTIGEKAIAPERPMVKNLGGLNITYDRITGRMRVQKGEFDSISIHAGKETCVSVDIDISQEGKKFHAPDWDFLCDFEPLVETGCFVICVGQNCKEFSFSNENYDGQSHERQDNH